MATEKRLIDANYLVNKVIRNCQIEEGGIPLGDFDKHQKILALYPTVDAVEVVRCKDCRWARQQDHREPTMTPAQALICECFMHHHIPAPWGARLAVKPDDFCSYGERRTDNG